MNRDRIHSITWGEAVVHSCFCYKLLTLVPFTALRSGLCREQVTMFPELVWSSFKWLDGSMVGERKFYFPDLELIWPTTQVRIELIRFDLRSDPSPFCWYPSDVPLTENFHRPPTSLLLSKQVGSSPSSRQHRMEAKPLTPAPTMATLFPMVARKEGLERASLEECPWTRGVFQ